MKHESRARTRSPCCVFGLSISCATQGAVSRQTKLTFFLLLWYWRGTWFVPQLQIVLQDNVLKTLRYQIMQKGEPGEKYIVRILLLVFYRQHNSRPNNILYHNDKSKKISKCVLWQYIAEMLYCIYITYIILRYIRLPNMFHQ